MTASKFLITLLLHCLLTSLSVYAQNSSLYHYKLHIVHLNDFHARFEEINLHGGKCRKGPCIGGFSRMYKTIQTILSEEPDSLLLNAGDNYQGTLYYNIFKWNITQHFMNKLSFDAITLGNHEFDDGVEGVVPFIKSLKAPVVLANMDDTMEPDLHGIYNKSVVIERNGLKFGIIGLLIKTASDLSLTGNLKFFDESESVNAEAERLVKEEGVFSNIVLSHCGYGVEKLIARNATAASKISVIIGGHTHSLLYTGDDVPGPDTPAGPYPTIIPRQDGNSVLVTQASAFTKYLGNISVYFDENGDVINWDGAPIFLNSSLPTDPAIDRELAKWKETVDEVGQEIHGSSLVRLERGDCRAGECLLGNFVTDAMVHYYTQISSANRWTAASICLFNTGGLRTTITEGEVTFDDVITAQPFNNNLYVGHVTGRELLEIFEFSATPYFIDRDFININLLQVSGVQVVIDVSKPIGKRITTLDIRCSKCNIPRYEPVDMTATYELIVPSFLTKGGDGFHIISKVLKNVTEGPKDIEVLLDYLHDKSPLFLEVGNRIKIEGTMVRNIFNRTMR